MALFREVQKVQNVQKISRNFSKCAENFSIFMTPKKDRCLLFQDDKKNFPKSKCGGITWKKKIGGSKTNIKRSGFFPKTLPLHTQDLLHHTHEQLTKHK